MDMRSARCVATIMGLILGPSQVLQAQSACEPLPPPTGTTITVSPAQADQLRQIIEDAESDSTILLEDGLYDMSAGDATSRLVFRTPRVTLRSASGNPSAVVLDGNYGTNELINIQASDVVIADLTLKRAYNHPIHATGRSGNTIEGIVIHNVDIIDPGQQAIKVNADSGGGYVDFGLIECSRIILTDTGRDQIRNDCYTGGIDIHKAWGWVVRRNYISGFWCPSGLSEHAIHFWNASRDTLIEENLITECVRGIGLGMRQNGPGRDYPDDPYPGIGYLGHIDGVVRNNFVAASDPDLFNSQFGFDAGITMEQSRGTEVLHNSIASTESPFSSIEWRYENTLVEIVNNIVTHNLRARNGGQASLVSNITGANPAWFVDIASGDLHLTEQAVGAIDAGSPLDPDQAPHDFDHHLRDQRPDIGADEVGSANIFADGFESGDLSRWRDLP